MEAYKDYWEDLGYLISKMPKECNNYLLPIQLAYQELKRADYLGLYSYKTSTTSTAILDGEKNYIQNLENLKKSFERLKIVLPENTGMINIPRPPLEIKKTLERKLILENVGKQDIKHIMEILFGTGENTRLPRKTTNEKMDLFFAKLFGTLEKRN